VLGDRPEWARINKTEIAEALNLTEVAVYQAFREAEAAGYIRSRGKNRNSEYSVNVELFTTGPLRAARKLERTKGEYNNVVNTGLTPTNINSSLGSAPERVSVELTCPQCKTTLVGKMIEDDDGVFRHLSCSRSSARGDGKSRVESTALTRANINSSLGSTEAKGIWEIVKSALRSSLPAEAYANWIERTEAASFDASELRVVVPNVATAAWLTEEYSAQIAELLPPGVTVRYIVRPPAPEVRTGAAAASAYSKGSMVEWLESRLRRQVGVVLSEQEADAIWVVCERTPRQVLEDAIEARMHKIRSWKLVLMIAEEAVGRYTKRRTGNARTQQTA